MGTETLTLKEYLDACREIEEIASQIYHFNAELFSDNDKVSQLWKKTAHEEEMHALQVGLAENSLNSRADRPFEEFQSESTRNLIRALFEAIKKEPPLLEEALRTAIACEEMLEKFHREIADCFTEKEISGLFKALMMHDREHMEDLERTLTNYTPDRD